MINFVNTPGILSTYPDQFSPYCAFDLNWSRPYNGTLFRLPLRTTHQAATSLLSKRAMGSDDVESLLRSLSVEASAMLLFLKSVERIEIQRWTSFDERSPEIIFSCEISNITKNLRENRAFVGEAVRLSNLTATPNQLTQGRPTPPPSQPSPIREAIADYSLNIACRKGASGSISESYNEIWEVCNQLGGGQSSRIAQNPANSLLRLVPWGGVAAMISTSAETTQNNGAIRGGLAYCFLPLPVQTGLPIMVNGFFELSSNRRDVWQAGPDMEGDGRTRAEWNVSLLRDIISPSYVRLLLRLRIPLGFSDHFQSLWPPTTLASPWSFVAESTLARCKTERLVRKERKEIIIHSEAAMEEKSEKPPPPPPSHTQKRGLGIFKSSDKNKAETIAIAVPPQVTIDDLWIDCQSAVLLPDQKVGLSFDDMTLLGRVLVDVGVSIVICLQTLRDTLVKSRTCELIATPSFTRGALRVNPSLNVNKQYIPNVDFCRFLMRYLLSDLSPAYPSADMDCLPILPLANRGVGILRIITKEVYQKSFELMSMGFSLTQARFALARTNNDVMRACELLTTVGSTDDLSTDTASAVYVVCNEEVTRIFHKAANTLLDSTAIGAAEAEFIVQKEMEMMSNIRPFSPALVPDLLRKILPVECFQGIAVSVQSLGSPQESILSFLNMFWPYACSNPNLISAIVEGASMVISRQNYLLPLSRMSTMIAQQRAEVSLPEDILLILEVLGGNIIDNSRIKFSGMPQVFWDYVHTASRGGVLAILESLLRQNWKNMQDKSSSNKRDIFESLAPQQRHELFSFLASSEQVGSLTGQSINQSSVER
jgi:hypothetical protein